MSPVGYPENAHFFTKSGEAPINWNSMKKSERRRLKRYRGTKKLFPGKRSAREKGGRRSYQSEAAGFKKQPDAWGNAFAEEPDSVLPLIISGRRGGHDFILPNLRHISPERATAHYAAHNLRTWLYSFAIPDANVPASGPRGSGLSFRRGKDIKKAPRCGHRGADESSQTSSAEDAGHGAWLR